MSNLTRPTQDLLKNTLSKDDFGMYFDTNGKKHLVLKKDGYDFIGENTTVTIKTAAAGQKMKRTLTIDWLWNGEGSQLFEIQVTKQPLINTRVEDQFPLSHLYSFMMTGFVTATEGTLHNTDKDAILDGLIAAITADVQLNNNAIQTGAVVVATKASQQLILESLEIGKIFTVETFAGMFSQSYLPTVGYMKNKLTNDEVCAIFSVKPEHVGTRVNVPVADVDYACITLSMNTQFVGLDLLGGTGQVVNQKLNIYTPVSQLAVLVADLPASSADNTNGMAGTTPDVNIIELLENLVGTANTNLDVVATAAIAGVTAPVKSATPVAVVTETDEYTGVVTWKVTEGAALVGAFAATTLYTATITLTAKPGKTFEGVAANLFTVADSLTDTNPANSGVVTATFAATGA